MTTDTAVDSETHPLAAANTDDEVARLEALLLARAAEARDLGAEVAHVRGLLRDALSRPVAATADPDPARDVDAELVRLREERDVALRRAIESEAARAEERFLLDEAQGRLALAAAGQGTESATQTAALSGRERGLRARLAETVEAWESAEARAALLEDDFHQAQIRARLLERELVDVREDAGLVLAAMGAGDADTTRQPGSALSELRGELAGLRARADEAESAFEAVRVGQARARAELVARIGQAREALGDARDAFGHVAQTIRAAVARQRDELSEPTLAGVDAPEHEPRSQGV